MLEIPIRFDHVVRSCLYGGGVAEIVFWVTFDDDSRILEQGLVDHDSSFTRKIRPLKL